MSFDVLAPHYRWMEFVLAGEKLQRCRTRFIDSVPEVRNVLLAGEGHGRFLVECCRRFQGARVVCVDASGPMLDKARRFLERNRVKASTVDFIQADVLNWRPPVKTFDLIATNFFLDCFRKDELQCLIDRLAAAAVLDAHWLIADFQIAAAGLRRIRSRLILWLMYVFFRAVTRLPAVQLCPPDSMLNSCGFVLHRRVESEWGLLHSDWWRRP